MALQALGLVFSKEMLLLQGKSQPGQLLHPQADGQIDLGLHSTVRRHRTAVHAPMARVNDQHRPLLQDQIFGRVDRASLPENCRESRLARLT